MFARLSLAGLALALAAAPALAGAGDYPYKAPDPARYPTPMEELAAAVPHDTIGRYPRPTAIGNDMHIPLGAYLPVPPNAFNDVRTYAPGEAALPVYAPRRVRRAYGDVKGRATHDRRTAWQGEPRGALVEPPFEADARAPVFKD